MGGWVGGTYHHFQVRGMEGEAEVEDDAVFGDEVVVVVLQEELGASNHGRLFANGEPTQFKAGERSRLFYKREMGGWVGGWVGG